MSGMIFSRIICQYCDAYPTLFSLLNWRTAMCEDIADEEEEGEVKVEEEVEGAGSDFSFNKT